MSECSSLVATIPSIHSPILSVSVGRCPKDTSFVVSMLAEFVRFFRSLEFDSLAILEKKISRLSSSIRGDAVFLSLVGDY